jgi:hypothetical protein
MTTTPVDANTATTGHKPAGRSYSPFMKALRAFGRGVPLGAAGAVDGGPVPGDDLHFVQDQG